MRCSALGRGIRKGKINTLKIEFLCQHQIENIDHTYLVHITTSVNIPGCIYVLQLSAARAAAISDCTACNSAQDCIIDNNENSNMELFSILE